MCARNVSVHLKPNTLSDFRKTFETNVLPILRKQKGFQDEITFSTNGGLDVVAISLWDTKEHAETYNTIGYPEVLNVGGWLQLNFDSRHIRQIPVPELCALENEVMVWRPLGKRARLVATTTLAGESGLAICQAPLNALPELGNRQGSVLKR